MTIERDAEIVQTRRVTLLVDVDIDTEHAYDLPKRIGAQIAKSITRVWACHAHVHNVAVWWQVPGDTESSFITSIGRNPMPRHRDPVNVTPSEE